MNLILSSVPSGFISSLTWILNIQDAAPGLGRSELPLIAILPASRVFVQPRRNSLADGDNETLACERFFWGETSHSCLNIYTQTQRHPLQLV